MLNEDSSPVNCAIKYAKAGYSIIPVGHDKKPIIEWKGYQTKRADEKTIRDWWSKYPSANIGIVTGEISGIVVVDVEAGGSTKDLPTTITSKTGGGGFHFFYKHPGKPVKNAVRIREKTDIRGDGGYIVAPPSLHKSGKRYEWLVSPEDAGFAELPKWVLEKTSETKINLTDWREFLSSENQKGSRNDSATKLIGKLLYHLPTDLWEISGLATLKEWNSHCNNPPLPDKELKSVWLSIEKAELEKRVKNQNSKPSQSETIKRNPISFQQLEETIKKWLLIEDVNITKVVIGAVIANRLAGDPVWLFIVAPSGGTKTEFIRGLDLISGIYPISDLTTQTFISGERGNKNASLLFRLPTNAILTYKDFTTVLTMHQDKKHAILAQLREIYDGSYSKEFGTGETKRWKGKIGFIAGVTSIIDHHTVVYSVLGERFIQYRPLQPDSILLSKRAMKNTGKENPMRDEIQNAFADYISGIQIPAGSITLPDEITDKIAHLATFCVKARSGIVRDGYASREIELVPDPEVPTRFAKQLVTLGAAFYVINGDQFSDDDYNLLCKIGVDSIPKKRRIILELLASKDVEVETAKVATEIGYPTNTTRRELENLHGLGLLKRFPGGQGRADRWSLNDKSREYIKKALPQFKIVDPKDSPPATLPEESDIDNQESLDYGFNENIEQA